MVAILYQDGSWINKTLESPHYKIKMHPDQITQKLLGLNLGYCMLSQITFCAKLILED